jgi:hypothetical protein
VKKGYMMSKNIKNIDKKEFTLAVTPSNFRCLVPRNVLIQNAK